jgi:hypothetical protein
MNRWKNVENIRGKRKKNIEKKEYLYKGRDGKF